MIRASLQPLSFCAGDELVIQISGLPPSGPESATVQVACIDTIETTWTASLGGQVRPDGTLTATWSEVGIAREAAVFPTVIDISGVTYRVDQTDVAIANPTTPVTTLDEALVYKHGLLHRQHARYAAPLGDPSADGVLEHRVICAIERLLITTSLRLPGVRVVPCATRPQGDEQRLMVDRIVTDLGWPTRIDTSWWAKLVSNSRPWTAIVCNPSGPQTWRRRHEWRGRYGTILWRSSASTATHVVAL